MVLGYEASLVACNLLFDIEILCCFYLLNYVHLPHILAFVEKTFKQWNSIPLDTKKEALQLLKTGFFWAPILLHHCEYNTTGLAAEIGLPDRK